MMKKLVVWLLIASMVFSMVACGAKKDEGEKADPTPTTEVTPEPSPSPTEAPTDPLLELHKTEYTSIKEAYADYFMIGTIYNPNLSEVDRMVIKQHFNVITPENLMKPESMQPSEGVFNYNQADLMMLYAESEGMKVIGHTLAWHQQSGNWLGTSAANREEAIQQLKDHIYGVAGKYEGKIYSWDVVNEAIRDGAKLPANGDWRSCLRESQWTKSIGTDFIDLAFQFAREAAPTAKLYYNDYNMDDQNKAEIAAAMIADLRSQGIPVDGIGMQGHYSTGTNLGNVVKSLERFKAIDGLLVSVTELDVTVNGVNTGRLNKTQELMQAVVYANLFSIYKDYADIIERVTFWGYRDNTSWRSEGAPLLFDRSLLPKEAYYAVLNPEGYIEYAGGGQAGGDKVETKKAEAVNGTPTIDGVADDIWNGATKYNIANSIFAWQGATGTVQMMWDTNNFYALVSVTDPVLNASNSNAYEQDSVEFFLDQNNCKNSYYDAGCGQYRSNYYGVLSYGEVPTQTGVKAAAKTGNGGYVIEFCIPLLKNGTQGTVMGFDAQINDANAAGSRQSVMKFNGTSDSDYTNPAAWAEVTFK